jgi:hypothetical protein
MTTTAIAQTRLERFEEWAKSWAKPRIEDALSDSDYTLNTLPRFATCSYDGTESWFRFYDSITDAASGLAGEASDEIPWGPSGAIDLDTGLLYEPEVTVQLVALRFSVDVTFERDLCLTYRFASREDAENFLRRLGDTATATEIRERDA